ncbi:hypothetical protein MMYC01_208496 [Madurella mycetomatis]|uniref:Uncharacterized protein n=1 Tax=Madurella mycetomatis TaxID=100816 RepID=A0A175VR50_9PEZI|nr:hypothetical protein MMYC01_209635 [Madurella mycetomatis]KXX75305.1 hypothetical protein MMYC01_208496 [Madurella mycetomatis]
MAIVTLATPGMSGLSLLQTSRRPEKPASNATRPTAAKTEPQQSGNLVGGADPTTVGLCGNSATEARALGCTFDQLTWSWYPPSCPHYANDEFVKAEDWKFYLDKYGQEEATSEDWERAMNNELQLYGERREHITHCVYLMLSVAQVVRDGTPHPKKLVEYGHLAHCATLMLRSLRKDKYWKSMDTLVPFVDYSVTC